MSDLPHEPADDAFHEIQLSGKQLVFLFMATTVVSVVIFLCGVLVGRGVRVEGAAAASLPQAAAGTPDTQSGLAADNPAPTPEPQLSYPETLEAEKPPAEKLRRQTEAARAEPAPAPAAVVPDSAREPATSEGVPATTPPPAAAPEPSAPAAARKAGTRGEAEADPKPSSTGEWVVQVQALRDRGDAEAIAKRLRAKNYEAFVLPPDAGGPGGMYRVQVGRFKDRAAAEATARRLKQEEKFSPWVRR